MNYFLGVDIGGTKSHALVVDSQGKVLGFGRAGAGNWESVGYSGLERVLREITDQAIQQTGITLDQIAGAGLGIAGFDWPSQRQTHLDVIRKIGLRGPIELVNDAALGIPAGTKEGWGVSIVSGTGCNGRGWNRDRSREGRAVGGHGHWSDEAAGGSDIVLRAMRAVAFQWTRRGPETALTQAFLQKTGASDLDALVEGIYLEKYRFNASFVMLVFEIAAQGDPEALAVMRWAGEQLGQIACGVIRQAGLEKENFEVVQIGSLYDGHPLIGEQMQHTIHPVAPGARLIRLTAPPVVGGALLGMETKMGRAAYAYRDQVIQSMKEFE